MNKIIDVWFESECEWYKYTCEEMDECFNFVTKPNWGNVKEVRVFNGGNGWMDIVFNTGASKSYNSVFGTYVEVGA